LNFSAQNQWNITETVNLMEPLEIEAKTWEQNSIGNWDSKFYFSSKKVRPDSIYQPAIITNKHSLMGFKNIKLFFKTKEVNTQPEL